MDLDQSRLGTDRLLTSQWCGGFGAGVQFSKRLDFENANDMAVVSLIHDAHFPPVSLYALQEGPVHALVRLVLCYKGRL